MLMRENTVLAIVDFQDKLLPKIDNHQSIVRQAERLIRFAREFDLPILWTEQYKKGLGPTSAALLPHLEGIEAHEKMSFGCLGDPACLATIEATRRRQILVAGIEAHICVMQTVLEALDRGYEVFVVRDAVGSCHPSDCQAGLERMARNHAQIVTAEMAMFEMLRQAGTPEFKRALPLFK